MAKTRAQLNRAIRQEALREQLAKQKHLEQVVDCAKKIGEPGATKDEVYQYKTKAELHLKLVNKYLPDLQSMQLSGDPESPVMIAKVERTVVDPKNPDS